MDWLATTIAAAMDADAAQLRSRLEAIAFAGAYLLAIAAIVGVVMEGVARKRAHRRLAKDVKTLKTAVDGIQNELTLARDGMLAVHQALASGGADGGASKRRIEAMEDEVAVLQKLVARLQQGKPVKLAGPAEAPKRPTQKVPDDEVLDLVRAAVAEGAIDLHLQPVVTLPQRRRRYYECFSRVPDQRGGVLTADAYYEAASAAGLMAPIDNLLLFRAVQLVRRARNQSAHIGFFCNVSPLTLQDTGFMQDFVEFLEENPDLAPSLILEIGQGDWDPADDVAAKHMNNLMGLGVRFSLDQVSSFEIDGAMLRRRGFRFVKANADALLSDKGPEPHGLKRTLQQDDIQLIVEKVERERDLVELLEHDIELGQGYLFGEPRAPSAAAA